MRGGAEEVLLYARVHIVLVAALVQDVQGLLEHGSPLGVIVEHIADLGLDTIHAVSVTGFALDQV